MCSLKILYYKKNLNIAIKYFIVVVGGSRLQSRNIQVIFHFLIIFSYKMCIMVTNNLNHEENIAKILNKMVFEFKSKGLDELARKGEKILKNYQNSQKLR
jgi:hypothetical protein